MTVIDVLQFNKFSQHHCVYRRWESLKIYVLMLAGLYGNLSLSLNNELKKELAMTSIPLPGIMKLHMALTQLILKKPLEGNF